MFSARSDPKSFTKFPKLPLEIQRMVWQFASFERRHVSVATKGRHYLSHQVTGEDDSKRLARFRSDISVPALFSVCRESRLEAKKHYKKALVAEHNFKFFSISLTPRFYINPDCDIICPVGEQFEDSRKMLLAAMHKAQCHSIALDESQWSEPSDDWNGPTNLERWINGIVRPPHSLRSITLYIGPNYGTPYKTGSRGSSHAISSVDWETIARGDQCALGAMIANLHRSITRYRSLIPEMAKDRHAVEQGRMSPPKHPQLARIPVFNDLSTKVLEKWTPPSLALRMHGVPDRVNGVLRSKDPFVAYHCGGDRCSICPNS